MLRRWLPAGVCVAAVVTGVVLAVGCSAPPPLTSSSAVTLAGGLRQFCRTNWFRRGGGESGGAGQASGTVTLCARWRYKEGVTTLAEVRGSFTASAGYLEHPSLRFNVETLAGFGRRPSVLVPWKAIPAPDGGQVSSADTGWFAAARLTGHREGSLSWRQYLYLSLVLAAGGAGGAGGAGMPVPAPDS